MEILLVILVIALVVAKDLSKRKDEIDKVYEDFSWKLDWWKYRNDNIIIIIIAGLIGGLVSSEVGLLFLDQWLKAQGMSNAVIETADYSAVFASTYGMIKLLGKSKQ